MDVVSMVHAPHYLATQSTLQPPPSANSLYKSILELAKHSAEERVEENKVNEEVHDVLAPRPLYSCEVVIESACGSTVVHR